MSPTRLLFVLLLIVAGGCSDDTPTGPPSTLVAADTLLVTVDSPNPSSVQLQLILIQTDRYDPGRSYSEVYTRQWDMTEGTAFRFLVPSDIWATLSVYSIDEELSVNTFLHREGGSREKLDPRSSVQFFFDVHFDVTSARPWPRFDNHELLALLDVQSPDTCPGEVDWGLLVSSTPESVQLDGREFEFWRMFWIHQGIQKGAIALRIPEPYTVTIRRPPGGEESLFMDGVAVPRIYRGWEQCSGTECVYIHPDS